MKRSFITLLVLALFGAGPGFAMWLCACSGPPKPHCCCEEDAPSVQDTLAAPCHTIEVARTGLTIAEAPTTIALTVPTLVELPRLTLTAPTMVATHAPEHVDLPGVAPPYLRVRSLRI